LLLLGASGCVREAVLENDVRGAQSKTRALATASNLRLAEAALSAQLVELEALYQRDPSEARVRALLGDGYDLLARGFIEVRRLQAVAAGDTSNAERERRDQADAEARSDYYGKGLPSGSARRSVLGSAFSEVELACQKRDRAGYERELNELLARARPPAEQRLEHALTARLAALWLEPHVAERCGFAASATSVVPAAPSPASR
jgi:hypothetical protein